MNLNDLKSQVALGEDSRRQFGQDLPNKRRLLGDRRLISPSGSIARIQAR